MTMKNPRASARLREFLARAPKDGLVFRAAASAGEPVEILMYDQIGEDWWTGEGVTAKDVVAALVQADGAPIVVRINSPGGDVFEGYAIYNALANYKGGVTTVVDGLAASAASWIALAGSSMSMAPLSMLMIHNSATLAMGDKHDLAATAAILAKLDSQFVDIYAGKSKLSAAELTAAMDAETWYTAAEALEAGFADTVLAKAAEEPDKEPDADPDDKTNTARRKHVAMCRLRIAEAT
jgi:ATP-dependent protease ClpP protease subunit